MSRNTSSASPEFPHNSSKTFEELLNLQLSRRTVLKQAGVATALAFFPFGELQAQEEPLLSSLSFEEIKRGMDEHLHIPPSYRSQVLIRWGDPLFPTAPAFNPLEQSAESQSLQFGFNNDFVGFFPLPQGSNTSSHGLLTVNHEYTLPHLMYPGSPLAETLSQALTDVDIVAHGLSIFEIRQNSTGAWEVVLDSPYNRRITPHTPLKITGPVAGSPRLKTSYSVDSIQTRGTYSNCAGGLTPWGTLLTSEENFQDYFMGDSRQISEAENHKRYGVTGVSDFREQSWWGKHYDRWNLAKEPHEPLHMGWMVEIDPYHPEEIPQKRTALGRFRHEGAGFHINTNQQIVVYLGDDQRFEYLYRFITKEKYNPEAPEQNLRLLEEGTLSVAEFTVDNRLIWHPLVYGEGALTPPNGFSSQGDVLIDTRKAADLVGATPMDRPEDVEVNPSNGYVYVLLTKNDKRLPTDLNPANPRPHNLFGHILELKAPQGDHCASVFEWGFFLMGGNPKEPQHGALCHPKTSDEGWLVCPDNCTFDKHGRLWIGTDGAIEYGFADGLWACDVEGPGRALTKQFLRTPQGAELTGPYFTPDNTSLFCSIQHPGDKTSKVRHSTFDEPTTRWPDFQDTLPPRPSVVVIQHSEKKGIGA
jgi:secreted PhoX family phosphatase